MLGVLLNVASLAVPSPLAKLAEIVRPNPYAPRVPDQARIAASQNVGALAGGLTGRTGSEAEWADDQGAESIGYTQLRQELPSARRPPSYFALGRGIHGDPGADRDDPTTLADFDRRPQGNQEPWGGSTRTVQNGANRINRATLLEPLAVTPTARQMVAGRDAGVPASSDDAMDNAWSD